MSPRRLTPASHTFLITLQFSLRSLLLRKAGWLGTIAFSACVLVLFPFAFGTETVRQPEVRYGAFWAVSQFAVALAVLRLFAAEQEAGALEFLLASRSSRAAVFFGKMAFMALQMLSIELPLMALWSIFYNFDPAQFLASLRVLAPAVALYAAGTAALGVLVHGVTARSLAREMLVPLLFFPLQISLLLAAVQVCLAELPGGYVGGFSGVAWWTILIASPVLFGGVGALVADALFEE